MNTNGNSVKNPTEVQNSATRVIPPVVTPLLDKIEWDQGNPYNLDCPEEKGELTVTGCAATALCHGNENIMNIPNTEQEVTVIQPQL